MPVTAMNEKAIRLIQLPNKDLWRGRVQEEIVERPDTVDSTAPATSEDAVLEMFAAQKSETIHCVWCGTEFTRSQFNELRAHVEKLHPSALKPLTDSEVELIDMTNATIVAKVELNDE